MGYIENLQAQAQQAAKAKAFDDMQMKNTLKTAYKQGNGDAYEAGRRDTAAELNALMAEAAKQERAGLAATYEAQSPYPQGPELFQGGQMPQDQAMPDLQTRPSAPVQGLAQSAVR
jgi:hypothetical protein